MKEFHYIVHWNEGYWSEERQSFGGILFAKELYSEEEIQDSLHTIQGLSIKGPFLLTKAYDYEC